MSEPAHHLIWVLFAVAGLWMGTVLTLRGAVRMSLASGVPETLIGMLVLGVGTNVPEVGVALAGAASLARDVDASGVVVGSVTGSALAQVALIVGLAGMIAPVIHPPNLMARAALPLLAAALLLGVLGIDGAIGRLDGLLLLGAFALHGFVVLRRGGSFGVHSPDPVDYGLLPAAVITAIGLAVTGFFAHLVVGRGVALATAWGTSQTLVGLLIVGVGASLPELVLSVGAALRGRPGLSLGAAFGNATFDVLVPLGAAALLHPLAVASSTIRLDLPALAICTGLVLVLHRRTDATGPTPSDRRRAAALVATFALYAVVRIGLG